MPTQSLGWRFPIGWQEAPLHFPPPLLPRGVKRTGLIWDHTVEGREPTKGQVLGHIWAPWPEDSPETYSTKKIIMA